MTLDKTKPDTSMNMDPSLARLLVCFIFDVYQEHIEPFSDSDERFGYKNIFG